MLRLVFCFVISRWEGGQHTAMTLWLRTFWICIQSNDLDFGEKFEAVVVGVFGLL
jgi:hypothetical protein